MKSLEYQGDSYQVSLTRPKRGCDVARFQVQKAGGNTYTVTFQNHQGTKGQCDCQAGKHRKFCRHQKMLKPLLDKAVAAASGKAPAPKPAPVKSLPAQISLALPCPAADQYKATREEYRKIRIERDALDTKLKALEVKGKALKAKLEAA